MERQYLQNLYHQMLPRPTAAAAAAAAASAAAASQPPPPPPPPTTAGGTTAVATTHKRSVTPGGEFTKQQYAELRELRRQKEREAKALANRVVMLQTQQQRSQARAQNEQAFAVRMIRVKREKEAESVHLELAREAARRSTEELQARLREKRRDEKTRIAMQRFLHQSTKIEAYAEEQRLKKELKAKAEEKRTADAQRAAALHAKVSEQHQHASRVLKSRITDLQTTLSMQLEQKAQEERKMLSQLEYDCAAMETYEKKLIQTLQESKMKHDEYKRNFESLRSLDDMNRFIAKARPQQRASTSVQKTRKKRVLTFEELYSM